MTGDHMTGDHMTGDHMTGGHAGSPGAAPRAHLLSFALEEYFHNFDRVIDRAHWSRFERRVAHGTARVLDLLDAHRQRATFFCVGWVAEQRPDLVAEIARRGHEVASKGFAQRPPATLTPAEFRDDLARARDAIERVTNVRVRGYRAPGWLAPTDQWALDVLAEEGYAYDSSVKPLLRLTHGGGVARHPRRLARGAGPLWELPVSSVRLGGLHLPAGAGNYSRQLPRWLMRRVVRAWDADPAAPFHLYFHAWEFDAEQPHVDAASWMLRTRFYRNLDKAPAILADYLASYRFTSAAEYLGLAAEPVALHAPRHPERSAGSRSRVCNDTSESGIPRCARDDGDVGRHARPARHAGAPATPLSLVVPCYNEEHSLAYLANTLESVRAALAGQYALEVVFVDDASTDGTAAELARLFGGRADCRVVRHVANQGVARAILTGAAHARHDLIASLDCDCTYDPHEIGRMAALLAPGVDVVTGSPYHPEGRVRNVPGWRLGLSKGASACYRRVLRQKLHTYTSCFRVYRRSALEGVALAHGGFLGVAELLGRLDLAGRRVVEYPTTLYVRVLGRSKMRVARTVLGHLGLLTELAALRAWAAARWWLAGGQLATRHPAPRTSVRAAAAPAEVVGRDLVREAR